MTGTRAASLNPHANYLRLCECTVCKEVGRVLQIAAPRTSQTMHPSPACQRAVGGRRNSWLRAANDLRSRTPSRLVFGQADEMIVVVEGPSAAGKTSCAARLAPTSSLVAEVVGLEPPSGSSHVVAEFWTEANATRWAAALRAEAETGLAVCDTDPLKLHYHYCLMRIGVLGVDQLRADVQTARDAIQEQRLGIADLVVCEIPEPEVLEQRKRSDLSRSRRRFDVHRRLAEPLREWYTALAELDPDRVQWRYPDVLPAVSLQNRYDIQLFDAWMDKLGIG
jgi:hypothetical protein